MRRVSAAARGRKVFCDGFVEPALGGRHGIGEREFQVMDDAVVKFVRAVKMVDLLFGAANDDLRFIDDDDVPARVLPVA